MSRRWLAVVLLVGLLVPVGAVAPAVTQAQSSGQVVGMPVIEFSTASPELTPGTTGDLAVQLTNRGRIDRGGPSEHETQVTTARGLILEVSEGDTPIEVHSGQIAVGDVGTGTTTIDDVSLTVPEDIEPGTYELPVEYSYQYTRIVEYSSTEVEHNDLTRTRSATLEVEVTDRARFEVVGVDSDAQVGDDGDVALTLRNVGTKDARDASVTATSRTGELTFGTGAAAATSYVGAWPAGEELTVTMRATLADDASPRSFTVDVTVDYTDPDGIDRSSRTLYAGIVPLEEQTFAIEDLTSTLRVGEYGAIEGTVRNVGPRAVDSVVVRYADDEPNLVPVSSSVAVGSLGPGETAPFRLPIEVSGEAEAVSKALDLQVRYRTPDGDRRTFDDLEVVTAIAPERDRFSVDVERRQIEAGETRVLGVTITNEMNQTVTDVEARMFANDPLDTGTTDEGYVATLRPGESAELTFELSASSTAPRTTFPISFDVRYDDERGTSQLSDTIRVPVEVTPPPEGGLPWGLVASAGVVLLVAGAYLTRRRTGLWPGDDGRRR